MFLTKENKEYINNCIKSKLINLNIDEFSYVANKCHELIDYIYIKFLIKDTDKSKFFQQLTRKNNSEIIAVLNLFLPFIDDKDDFAKYKKIKRLEDITVLKENDKYAISNFQYSRGYWDKNTKKFNEYKYSTKDIEINFELLKQTINRMSYKMYINWINIVPVILDKYYECQLYKNSIEYYKKENKYFEERCLPIAEIFDTLVNDLYKNVLDYKWLLYERNIKGEDMMFIDILNKIYPVYKIIDNKLNNKWLILDEADKTLFSTNMDYFMSHLINEDECFGYSYKLIKEFAYNFFIFFDTKYPYKDDELSKKGYKKIIDLDDDDDDQQEDQDIDYTREFIIKNYKIMLDNYKKIDKYYLYDFIRNQILQLSTSWYGYKMFNDVSTSNSSNKKIIKLSEYIQNKTPTYEKKEHYYDLHIIKSQLPSIYKISYKTVYNYSKSLWYMDRNNQQISDPKQKDFSADTTIYLYDSKADIDKQVINDFIIQTFPIKFDIYNEEYDRKIKRSFGQRNNIGLKYEDQNLSRDLIIKINIQIVRCINNSILDITFECLAKRGLLSEYIIRDEKFDKENIKTDLSKDLLKKHLSKYKKAYYYLTDNYYQNLPIIINNRNLKEESYFDRLASGDLDWYSYYAMDWVSQINFFNHFINQRVVMLTGATGVGKSTQTPKLLLYGLKAIDKKFDGKIVCTQPRISPTVNNAQRISSELGVDITAYNTFYKTEVKTENGIIQYKYEKGDHIEDDQRYYLRIVTDGTLLVEIQKSPLIKQLLNTRIKESKFKNISSKNLYDIIIIDESHEHNSNMDIILSLLRGSVFLNNDLRLYIISATMDLDDPIYRMYYRNINDNLKYPIRDNLKNTEIVDKHEFNELLDRVVIDRRIHISPPGEGTQYVISEVYHEIDLPEDKAYVKAVEYAIEICNNNSPINNDILLFCTTTKKIIKLVDELNIKLPINTLAIPFYSDLPEDSKNLITQNLEKIKRTYNFDRRYIHDVLNEKYKPEDINTGNRYDRILIVSTNIAEASITINSLKFVIDTGYNWNVAYNYDTGTNNMESIKISEASRLQRKGRVGRVSSGSVYYTYPKDARLNIVPIYDICKKNFSNEILIFTSSNLYFKEGYNYDYYPFNYDYEKNIDASNGDPFDIYIQLNTEIDIFSEPPNGDVDSLSYRNSFVLFIQKQYLTFSHYSKKLYYNEKLGNNIKIYKETYENIVPFGADGLNTSNILDDKLGFYLIHPLEIEYGKYRDENTRLLSDKYKSESYKIKKNTTNKILIPLINDLYIYRDKSDNMYKAKIVEKLFEIKQKTDKLLDINLLHPIVIGFKLGVFENVLFIVYFLLQVKYDLYAIIDNITIFKKIFSDSQSDLLVINKIFTSFMGVYRHILLENTFSNKKIELEEKYKENYVKYKNKIFSELSTKEYNDQVDLLLKNNNIEIFSEKLFLQNKAEKIDDYILVGIKEWCRSHGINYIMFIKIIDEFRTKYFGYKNILNIDSKYYEYINSSSVRNELNVDRNVIKSFVFGNVNKLFYVEDGKYMPVYTQVGLYKYQKMNIPKKWQSNVIFNRFLLVLYKENAQKNENDEDTDNKTILLNIFSDIDNKMYSTMIYHVDNPTNKSYDHNSNMNHQFICNNPINIDHNKHPDDPVFNEYLNNLQISMKEYIDRNC